MKTVMVIIDGLSDDLIPELGNKTPLECAFIPNIDYIANHGKCGLINTCFEGYPIESMVCIMGLLGYDPHKYYPNGRASFEAMAKGIPLKRRDLVFRCNTITIDREKQTITDFTAGMISDSAAREIISKIELPFGNWELYPGQSYRNTLIIRDANVDIRSIKCYEPHMNVGRPIKDLMPHCNNSNSQKLLNHINEFLLDSQNQIEGMLVSSSCKANMLWVWSPSSKPELPPFKEMTGLNAACVCGLDFLNGLAMATGIHFDVIPGATGYINTNYQAKANSTIKYLADFDFVLTHINAADEEAHQRNFLGKQKAIEAIDEFVIAPVLSYLYKHYKNDFKIIVCGDHKTRCSDGTHCKDPVPFVLYKSKDIYSKDGLFNEKVCKNHNPISSLDFLRK